MKQLKVSLPDDLRKVLEIEATEKGHSIGEVIRARIMRTIGDDIIPRPVWRFMNDVGNLAALTALQTGQDWRVHPAAAAVLEFAINARLSRTMKEGPETFAPGELPNVRLVATGDDDLQAMGAGIEAILEFSGGEVEPRLLRSLLEERLQREK